MKGEKKQMGVTLRERVCGSFSRFTNLSKQVQSDKVRLPENMGFNRYVFTQKRVRDLRDIEMDKSKIVDLPKMRDRVRVFRDRATAGKVLADMLEEYRQSDAIVMGIPAGGIAVAVEIARKVHLPLDVAVVSKITLPWNTEAGYGAVAFDGTVLLNEEFLSSLNLSRQRIETGTEETKQKVARRVMLFRGNRPMPDFKRPIILVDDGLASGFTVRVAIEALRRSGATKVNLAVPTAHLESAQRLKGVEAIYCPNLRRGFSFAVADAYEEWRDLDEQEVTRILQEFKESN